MSATFVTFKSQIPSEVPPPPSLASRIVNFVNDSLVADDPLHHAGAAISVPAEVVDTDTSANSTVQRRSKRTRARRPSNDVEPIGDVAEETNVEFEAVDVPFVAEDEEVEAVDEPFINEEEEIVVRNPGNIRLFKEIECSLDGVYWAAFGPRIRRSPERLLY
jgi:hypothetical protein